MNLFELDEAITNCVKLENSDGFVNVETGEVIDTEALDNLKMERDTKLRNIGCWLINLKAEYDALAQQEKRFKERKEAVGRKMESLKGYVGGYLAGQLWKCTDCAYSWRKSDVVEIADGAKIPQEYMRVRTEPNKEMIKKALKNGTEIEGAVLVEKQNLSVK